MEKENKKPAVVLPQIKAPSNQQRFSSWNTNQTPDDANLDKHLSELDELLLENDELLTPIDKNDSFNMKKTSENDDSFDIENSDELNKLIDKYENTKSSAPELVLQNQQSTEKLPKNNDSFDEALEDLDLVEKEVSQGRSTAPSVDEVQKTATEITVKVESKVPEPEPETPDDDESVDDFIRKHMQDSAEKNVPVKQQDPLSDSDSDQSDGESLTPR